MSVNLMSKVFDYEFPKRVEYTSMDYTFTRDKETKKIISTSDKQVERAHATAGTNCKFVLLALSDHANDDGKGAYPSTKTLCRKTNLEKPTVIAALLALRYWGFIKFVGESPRETNNYDIVPETLVKSFDQLGKPGLPPQVNPAYRGGKPGLPESSFNHPFNPNDKDDAKPRANIFKVYEANIGAVAPIMAQELIDAEKEYPAAWIEPAFLEAARQNVRKWKYVLAILQSWKANGFGWKPERKTPPANQLRATRAQSEFAAAMQALQEYAAAD